MNLRLLIDYLQRNFPSIAYGAEVVEKNNAIIQHTQVCMKRGA